MTQLTLGVAFLCATSGLASDNHEMFAKLPKPKPVPGNIEYEKGPFEPTSESLKQYTCPDWFRDVKFGIWSHWGPQCVPEADDWYARHLYNGGHRQGKIHREKYGHPSEFGYKDILPLWKAEKFDPERLAKLYHDAGARFICTMAVHHDNFDLWNSTYHRWNSVNLGPKRDVLGDWIKAARKLNMKVAVSEHLAASWQWWRTNKGSDRQGDKKGVLYDGNDPRYADLYYPDNHKPQGGWYSFSTPEWFRLMYYWRMRDLLDQYKPDLFYSDGGFAFKEYGRALISHLYNSSANANNGKVEVVYASKSFRKIGDAEFVLGTCVEDYERGIPDRIMEYPWMTDTSVSGWFYNVNAKYKTSEQIIRNLVDIVSKNGTLLMNFVQHADGSLPGPQEQILKEMAGWMKVNSEGIYETRPWKVFGENAKPVPNRNNFRMNDTKIVYTEKDVRYSCKEGAVYAFLYGWPADGKVTLTSFADTGKVESITLLGSESGITFEQKDQGLEVQLAGEKPCKSIFCLKISGTDLVETKADQQE